METILLDHDITVFYITASSFPAGIAGAHERLHTLVPIAAERRYFGISRPEANGPVVYRAAAEQLFAGEAATFGCDTLVLQKGNYTSLVLHDYPSNFSGIGDTFQQLLSQPGLDPNGYCVEWYLSNKDVRCMVRLKDR